MSYIFYIHFKLFFCFSNKKKCGTKIWTHNISKGGKMRTEYFNTRFSLPTFICVLQRKTNKNCFLWKEKKWIIEKILAYLRYIFCHRRVNVTIFIKITFSVRANHMLVNSFINISCCEKFLTIFFFKYE